MERKGKPIGKFIKPYSEEGCSIIKGNLYEVSPEEYYWEGVILLKNFKKRDIEFYIELFPITTKEINDNIDYCIERLERFAETGRWSDK